MRRKLRGGSVQRIVSIMHTLAHMARIKEWQVRLFAYTAALISYVVFGFLPAPSSAGVPGTIAYQGFLASSGGAPVNGPIVMTFRLYTAVSGGSPIWSETQNVTVSQGTYTVLLGSVTSLNSVPFSTPYHLGVSVGTDAEMTPRQPLSSAPYALRAAIADTVLSTPVAVTTTRRATNTSGVGSSSCGSSEILVGGGCECSGARSNGTNYGVVFGCSPAGNGFVGGCYDYLYSSLYAPSPVVVRAICLTSIGFIGASASNEQKSGAEDIETALFHLRQKREELTRAQTQ